MRKVSKEEFYKAMGPLNVHPRPDVSTFKGEMFTSNWEMCDTRRLVGVSKSSSWGRSDRNEYFLVGREG